MDSILKALCWWCRARTAERQRPAAKHPLLQREGGRQLVQHGGACPGRVTWQQYCIEHCATWRGFLFDWRQHAVARADGALPHEKHGLMGREEHFNTVISGAAVCKSGHLIEILKLDCLCSVRCSQCMACHTP